MTFYDAWQAITNDGAKVHHSEKVQAFCLKVWAWGSNVYGQLGVGVDSSNAQRVKPSLIPARTLVFNPF